MAVSILRWMPHWVADKRQRERARWELHKNAISYLELILEAAAHETVALQTLTPCLKNYQNKTDKTCGNLFNVTERLIENWVNE